MKRGIILFAALLVAGMTAEAQTQNTFGGGDIVLSAGIGAGTALNIGNTVVPPIVIQGEYGIVDNLFDAYSSIGVSGYMGFAAGRKVFTIIRTIRTGRRLTVSCWVSAERSIISS